MATAYQLVEMPPGGNNGPHQSHPHNVQHHLHHHHHQQQQRHNQQLQPHEHDDLEHTQQPHQQSQIDGIFAGVIDERTPQFYEPTPPPSSDYYASPSYLHHVNHQHTDATATTTASSGAIFQNASHHLMANEDGYWGSPCSSDSTNGRDYSPTGSVNAAPTSPYQYAPVYYPPQYDRPELVYGDGDGCYYGAATDVGLMTPTTVGTGIGTGDAAHLSISASMLLDATTSAASVRGIVSCLSLVGGDDVTTTSNPVASGDTGGIGNAGSTQHGTQDGAMGGLMVVPVVRVVKRRTTANKKERRRTQSINSAFTFLRDCIPNVPSDTKLSKIKTLRLATSYISYLTRVLEGDQDPSGGFRAELVPSSRKINAERRAKYEAQGLTLEDIGALCLSSNTSSTDLTTITKKAKSRTGWPQHVWASELKQEQ